MNNVLEQLIALRDYYAANPQCGHTTGILLAAMTNPKSKILFESSGSARFFEHEYRDSYRSAMLMDFEVPLKVDPSCSTVRQGPPLVEQLAGHHGPLFIDNYAMLNLLNESVTEITRLKGEAEVAEQKAREKHVLLVSLAGMCDAAMSRLDHFETKINELTAKNQEALGIENDK